MSDELLSWFRVLGSDRIDDGAVTVACKVDGCGWDHEYVPRSWRDPALAELVSGARSHFTMAHPELLGAS